MTAFNIMGGIMAGLLFLFAMGEKDKGKQFNLVLAFVAVLLFIICNNVIM